jgi:hypothetical protein
MQKRKSGQPHKGWKAAARYSLAKGNSAMATTTHYFTGIVRQVFLARPDKFGNYIIGLELDDSSTAELAASGSSLKPRTWEGFSFVTFRRPVQKPIKQELVKFGPPPIVDAQSQPLTKLIGKGTKATAKVIMYPTIKGQGHRLEAVQVLELVEFVPQQKEGQFTVPTTIGVPEQPPVAANRPAIPF